VVLIGEGEDAELRDMRLGQVVRLGAVAAVVVHLLDGTRDTELLLLDAARILGEQLNPMGLVELLQALDRRALLDTPRARRIVAQGNVRADIAALSQLSRRKRGARPYVFRGEEDLDLPVMAPGSRFECRSCAKCCTEQHLLGPVSRAERDAIVAGFTELGDEAGADPSNFVPLPSQGGPPTFLLRPRGGRCSFLDESNRCRIHSELGEEVKPAACRQFPFRAVKTPVGWDVGLAMSCPTVARGEGPDPREEARRTVGALRVLRVEGLREVSGTVSLTARRTVDFGVYRKWESDALLRLSDDTVDPAEAWSEIIRDLVVLVHSDVGRTVDDTLEEMGPATGGFDDTPTVVSPMGETTVVAPVDPGTGVGDSTDDPRTAADIILRDMAIWCELLVGLEAANPMAIRRLRSSLLRVRTNLGQSPDAAPVLAEKARLLLRRHAAAETSPDVLSAISLTDPDGTLPPALGSQPAVQRRFLAQALMEKRLFEFSSIDRGVVSMTVFLSALRLPAVAGDEYTLAISDVAYLSHHPQLTDIVDSRAVVHDMALDGRVHRAILGLD
jgi:Fe-S-cluster containining protein